VRTLFTILRGIRKERANLDAAVAGEIKYMEGGECTPAQWREVLGGLEAEVSASVMRNTLRR